MKEVLDIMNKIKIIIILTSLFFLFITLQISSYKKLNDMEIIYLKELSKQNDEKILQFNSNCVFKYNDLSKKYRNKITPEEYENISNIWEASYLFNKTDIQNNVNKILSKHITGPAIVNQGIVDNKSYTVSHDIVLGIEYCRPVVLSWKIYVYERFLD